jgi:hypothetical protein
VIDVLVLHLGRGVVDTAIKNGNLEVVPLALIRGRSFDNAIILVDECFHGETEILTENGFIRFDELSDERVAQFEREAISFVKPDRVVAKNHSGEMVRMSKERFSMTATPDHRAVYIDKKGETVEQSFSQKPNTGHFIPLTTDATRTGKWNPLVALTCAIQADGSYGSTMTTAGNFTKYWTIQIKRPEKIERLRRLLKEIGIEYSEYEPDKRGRIRFYIPAFDTKYLVQSDLKAKTFCFKSIVADGLEADFLKEVAYWDGSFRGNGFTYCSTNKQNIDTVQAFAHLCGYSANFGVQHDARTIFKNTPKPHYRLNVSDRKRVTNQKLNHETIPYQGMVYCVTVPSGMIVVRQNGYVFVSGNCQNLTTAEMKAMLTRVGEGSQIILDGDVEQTDLKEQSGLAKIVRLAKKHSMPIPVVEFGIEDVVRSGICKMWLEVFRKEGL